MKYSPLRDVFSAWAQRLIRTAPPSADQIVIPDPGQLEKAALNEESAVAEIFETERLSP